VTTAGLILAAGHSTRFGSPKVLAPLDGRPLLELVLETARGAGLAPIVVVEGDAAAAMEAGVRWGDAQRVRNPDPGRGLSSSLRIGLEAVVALQPPVDGLVLLLGDQPLTRQDVIEALLRVAADERETRPIVSPRYQEGGGPHPVLIRRSAFDLVGEATGDRGLGPILARHPELVRELPVPGVNPDVDTPADLAAVAEAAWDRRVRANREQVDRVREVPDGQDFYAPVSSLFRADPDRSDDPFVDVLLGVVQPDETLLDIGCGAGRYALPLARRCQEVIGVDPSASMLAALREGMAEHGIANLRIIAGRWPMIDGPLAAGGPPVADVALIAHVGYDVEPIGPFLGAMEGAARRQCVALLADPPPASVADPFWPAVHGESRVPLPGAATLWDLLSARGRDPSVAWLDRPLRGHPSLDELIGFARRQLWVAPGGAKDRRLIEAAQGLAEQRDGRWYVRDAHPGRTGLITWEPPARAVGDHLRPARGATIA
jgi:molybdenum cofactor cytidylyltransferase